MGNPLEAPRAVGSQRRTHVTVVVAVLVALLLPAAASAFTPLPAGLPDGRVYEQASPSNKSGNFAGVLGLGSGSSRPAYGLATADGNAVLYPSDGGVGGNAVAGNFADYYVAQHVAGRGWQSAPSLPRSLEPYILINSPIDPTPSRDLTHVLFKSLGSYTAGGVSPFENLFLAGPDSLHEPAWVDRPAESFSPIPAFGQESETAFFLPELLQVQPAGPPVEVGGAWAVYFTYPGTLLPSDASRAPNVGSGYDQASKAPVPPWGFYEWRAGALSSAGVLPADSLYPGEPDPWGAIPASMGGAIEVRYGKWAESVMPDNFGNEVSADGSRAFFISPLPLSAHPANDPPQLYVRETAADGTRRTVLVSQDEQLPPLNGLPAPSPGGVTGRVAPLASAENLERQVDYSYASPDGSRVFFYSSDNLTAAAQGTGVKTYVDDLNANGGLGSLTYLPGVTGPILTSTPDGSRVLFDNTAAGTPQSELELWSYGPGGGTVTPVAVLPQPAENGWNNPPASNVAGPCKEACALVPESRLSADGSVVVFETDAPIEGGFNNGGGFDQIYRYDTTTRELVCVSCPPHGISPSGDARLSEYRFRGPRETLTDGTTWWLDARGISADGSRVFFDSPDPLVAEDANGVRDVYEWEAGRVFPISSGRSPESSFLLDSSESGGDVFFATTEGIASGDTDGAYDVYDARVPHPGDNPPPAAVPCQGEVCQGPPSVPQLFSLPASSTFDGLGNVQPQPQASAKAKPAAKAKTKRKAKTKKGKRGRGARRAARKANRNRGGK